MSERVINDPESAGWEFDPDTGYWMWVGASEIPDGGGSSLWEQNGDNIYYNDGNVGIGASDVKGKLHVSDGVSGNPLTSSLNTVIVENDGNAGISVVCGSGQMSAIALHGGSKASDASIRYIENTREVQHWVGGQQRMTIDANGDATFSGAVASDGNVVIKGDLLPSKSDAGSMAVSIGFEAGRTKQGYSSVAVGFGAGRQEQASGAVSIGKSAGYNIQSGSCVAVGESSGYNYQGYEAIAVGLEAGKSRQGGRGVAVGVTAGKDTQGAYSVAVGYGAGETSQGEKGIIINSSGVVVNDTSAGHIIIKSSTQDLRSLPTGGFAMNRDPIIGTRKLISTLSTLRNATMDETTLEGMRDALADAIGGLIENLEHEIAAMPAPEPEASTQEIADE